MTGGKIKINLGSTVKKAAHNAANPKKRKAILDQNVLGDLPKSKKPKPSEPSLPSCNQTEIKAEAERSQIFGIYEDQASEEEEEEEEEVSTSVRDCKGRHFSATKEAEFRESFQIIIKAEGPCPSYEFEMSGRQLADIAGWQNFSAISGGQKGKDFRKQKKHNDGSSPTHSRQSSISSTPSRRNAARPRGYRENDQYIFFFGSVLSNFNKGAEFSGHSTLSYLLRELDQAGITHPSKDALATELLATHYFSCGEQWMMACKAWLFECPSIPLAYANVTDLSQPIETIRLRLMQPTAGQMNHEGNAFRQSILLRILRASDPKTMKDLGRQCPGWDERVWNRASIPIVVAGTVASAEADQLLGKIYRSNKAGSKKFVEGSPYDRIWGVGIEYGDPKIENEMNWRGSNRLGKCHDEACRVFCERQGLTPQRVKSEPEPEEGKNKVLHRNMENDMRPTSDKLDTKDAASVAEQERGLANKDSKTIGGLREMSEKQIAQATEALPVSEKTKEDSQDKAEKMEKGKKEFIETWQRFSGKRGGEKGKAFR